MRTLTPELHVIAHMREGKPGKNGKPEPWTRSEEIDYANAHGLEVLQTKANIYSVDENLWGRSIEGGRLEEPDFAPPEEIFRWTRGLEASPNQPRVLRLTFENGVPVAIDGKRLSPLEVVTALNVIAGDHGVGRVDIIDD